VKINMEGHPCLLSSGAPDSPVRHRTTIVVCPVRDFLPNRAQSTVAAPGPWAHRTLSDAHRTVRCPPPTIGAATRRSQISWPTVGAGDRWLTGQSGAPPDSPVRHRTATVACLVRDCLPNRAQTTIAAPGQLAHRTVRCPPPTVGAATRRPQISRSTVGAGDRWLTGQSGAPPDSPVNFSHVAFLHSRESRVRLG
jgi:hypothetical protein